jgi:phosphopantothenoylcysteine decarboxylase/phosphopantothenate--cysteine ligase
MNGKTILLGVSGGIAAYKACELASRLTQTGATVRVVMTPAATRFVQPLTFQALTHQPVHTSLWPESTESESGVYAAMAHIALADEADAILIAPASADIIARLAQGMAGDLLTTLVLATRKPVLLSPAMNPKMLSHPATQRNLATLRELGYTIIDPESGRMACEHVGPGRLPTTEAIMAVLQQTLDAAQQSEAQAPEAQAPDAPVTQDLAGKTVLVTAGPTREPIDPVRFISNRSSGKMGYAIAAEAARRGAKVVLVSGPVNIPVPHGLEKIAVTTTQEMYEAATREAVCADIVIAAAAPADYRMQEVAPQKLKKIEGEPGRTLHLTPTPDILAAIGQNRRDNQLLIGFAAETENMVEHAQQKLSKKNCDVIIANDVSQQDAGFDVETNRVTWVTRQDSQAWPLLTKTAVAGRICDHIVKHFHENTR